MTDPTSDRAEADAPSTNEESPAIANESQITGSRRRRFLTGAATTAAAALSGCLGLLGGGQTSTATSDDRRPTGTPETPEQVTSTTTYPQYSATSSDVKTQYPRPENPGNFFDPDSPSGILSTYSDMGQEATVSFWRDQHPKLEDYYKGDLKLVYYHTPVQASNWSVPLHCAAMEVQVQQGLEAFWTFHQTVIEYYGNYSWDKIRSAAEAAGSNPDQVIAAAQEDRRRGVIHADNTTRRSNDVGDPFVAGAGVPVTPVEPPTAQNILSEAGIEQQN